MSFKFDSTNIKPQENKFALIPEGEYKAVIQFAEESTSKKGMPMVVCTLSIIEHEEYHGKTLKHYVVFIPAGEKGDSMSVHFRKVIGIPYAGNDEVDANHWIGKKLRIKLKIKKNIVEGKLYENNNVAEVMPYGETVPEVEEDISF